MAKRVIGVHSDSGQKEMLSKRMCGFQNY